MNSQKVIRIDGFVKRPSSRRANFVECGVLTVRRSDNEMKRNAEIGLFTKPSRFLQRDRPRPDLFQILQARLEVLIVMGLQCDDRRGGVVGSEEREQRLEVDPAGAQSEVIVPLPEVVVQVELADEAAQGLEPLPERCSAEDGQVPAVQAQPDTAGLSCSNNTRISAGSCSYTFSSISREPSRFRASDSHDQNADCWPTIRPGSTRDASSRSRRGRRR